MNKIKLSVLLLVLLLLVTLTGHAVGIEKVRGVMIKGGITDSVTFIVETIDRGKREYIKINYEQIVEGIPCTDSSGKEWTLWPDSVDEISFTCSSGYYRFVSMSRKELGKKKQKNGRFRLFLQVILEGEMRGLIYYKKQPYYTNEPGWRKEYIRPENSVVAVPTENENYAIYEYIQIIGKRPIKLGGLAGNFYWKLADYVKDVCPDLKTYIYKKQLDNWNSLHTVIRYYNSYCTGED